MNWRRFDTLGLRLFVLMWVVLVISHLTAFSLAMPLSGRATTAAGVLERLKPQNLPTLTSLPPGTPFDTGPPGGPPRGPGGPGQRPAPDDGAPRGAGAPPPGGPPPDWAQAREPRPAPGGAASGPGGAEPGPPPRGMGGVLWADYGVRLLITAIGAAIAARWLAAPMRRLARASRELSQGLARGQPPPVLDEHRGSREVRETAHVFNDMAQRLQEQFDARGMHLASVSHDLRTPLTRLRMRLEDAPPRLAAGAAADIQEMSEMIDATLEVLQEQREGSQARALDVTAMLQALVDDLAAAGQNVSLSAPPQPLVATARAAALRRILGNLVGNALRYGNCARVALRGEGQGVEIVVDDDGPGIPEAQLELAFRPWVRLTQAHARSGHGLGLAIARDLAERDGGRVALANRSGGGLRASLWLPARA